tara:strand:- start:3237 stop:5075 length:1839 start_codon:yes stop_codon:yes gene_type:complete
MDELDEAGVLSLQQRRKKAITIKRFKTKLKVARKKHSRRMADPRRMKRRAARAAVRVMRKKLAGNKGAKYSKLSGAEKIVLDRRVQARKTLIRKIAKRLIPKVRKQERTRFKHKRARANESFEQHMNMLMERTEAQAVSEINAIVDTYDNHEDSDAPLTEKAFAHIVKLSQQNLIPLDELIEAYDDGFANPHGEQKPAQSGFMNVNLYIEDNKKLGDDLNSQFESYSSTDQANKKQKRETRNLKLRHTKQDSAARRRDINRRFNEALSPAQAEKKTEIKTAMLRVNDEFTTRYGDDSEKVMDGAAEKLAVSSVSEAHRPPNPVAKNLNKFNKAATMVDRKKKSKAGYEKHKQQKEEAELDELSNPTLNSYRKKAAVDYQKHRQDANDRIMNSSPVTKDEKAKDKAAHQTHNRKMINRSKGHERATDKILKSPYKEEHGAGEEGTNKLVKKYTKETPGQKIEESSPEAVAAAKKALDKVYGVKKGNGTHHVVHGHSTEHNPINNKGETRGRDKPQMKAEKKKNFTYKFEGNTSSPGEVHKQNPHLSRGAAVAIHHHVGNSATNSKDLSGSKSKHEGQKAHSQSYSHPIPQHHTTSVMSHDKGSKKKSSLNDYI